MAQELGMGVDTNVSPSFHPQIIASLDDYNDDTRGELDQVVQVFTATYESIGNLHAVRDAVRNDPSMTEAAQVIRVADAADKLLKTATDRFNKTASNMRGGIALIESQLTSPIQSRANHGISSEIRAYAREQKSPVDFVRSAIVKGDLDSASAVLGAPPYLSGLTPEAHTILLRMHHEHSNPVAAQRQRAMQGALDLLTDRAGLLQREVDRAVGVPAAVVRKFRDAKARADKAFAR